MALAWKVLPARGDIVLLTFEGLKHGEQVLNFYDGGTGSMGSTGTNYGVTFDTYALALTHGSYIGEPSPPTIMSLINQNGSPESRSRSTWTFPADFKQPSRFMMS